MLFYAGLRRSEAAELVWGDVEASEDGSGLLWVRRSKTDPEAEGSARYLPRAAVEALEAVRPEKAGPEASGAGFPGTPGARAWSPSSAAPAPPPTRSPRRAAGSPAAW